MPTIDRRSLLGAGAAAGLALAAGGCRADSGRADSGELMVSWYGGAPVHEAMNAVLDSWSQAQDGVTAIGSGVAFNDYWDKLATETAAGEPPDVFRMSMTYFVEYASRGVFADVSALNGLDLSLLDEDVRGSGLVDGTLYGVGQSSIAPAIFSSRSMVSDAGAEVPVEWTWDDFRDWVTEFATDTGKYGTTDMGGNFQMFDVYARQEVGNQFADDGSLQLTPEVIAQWFTLWDELRKAKAAPPSDVTAAGGDFETNPMSTGDAALTSGWVQQVTFYQPLIRDGSVEVSPMPQKTKGDFSGLFVKALDFWCISANAANPDAAAQLVNHLINDAEATDVIGLLLGVPPTEAARESLAHADRATRAAVDYIDDYAELAGPAPGPWPTGYGELLSAFTRANESVGFGKAGAADAATTFLEEAQRALGG